MTLNTHHLFEFFFNIFQFYSIYTLKPILPLIRVLTLQGILNYFGIWRAFRERHSHCSLIYLNNTFHVTNKIIYCYCQKVYSRSFFLLEPEISYIKFFNFVFSTLFSWMNFITLFVFNHFVMLFKQFYTNILTNTSKYSLVLNGPRVSDRS